MPKRIPVKQVDAAIVQLDKVRKQWLRRPGVTAVDVGYKISDNELTDQLSVRVHVKRKIPVEAIEKHEIFSTPEAPEKLGDFPIDVIEAEYGPSQPLEVLGAEAVNRRSRVNPLIGGISVGHPQVTAGTLGAIVWDTNDGEVCLLSNWHVLCGSPSCSAGDPTYQPGVYDGGTAADTVAELKRWHLNEHADAAIAKLNGARSHSQDILDLSPITGIDTNPILGLNVHKSGRTTAVTRGIIDGVSASVTIDYGGGVVQTFHDQLHIVPRPPWPAVDYEVSKGGDSGSVWIGESSGKAVGLHFAGETNPAPIAEHAIANRMVKVAELLDISFKPVFVICTREMLCLREMHCLRELICYPEMLCYREMICIPLISPVCRTLPVCPAITPVGPLVNPFRTGGSQAHIDLDKLPPEMRRAVEMMLAAIDKYQREQ
jgi:endonuclease G